MASCATRLSQVECDDPANGSNSDDTSISSSSSSGSSSSPKSRQRQQHHSTGGSPKQGSKFSRVNGHQGHTDDAVFNLGSIPHHFTAFSVSNEGGPAPTVTVHCLDYVL